MLSSDAGFRESYSQLSNTMREAGFGWVVDQVEAQISPGTVTQQGQLEILIDALECATVDIMEVAKHVADFLHPMPIEFRAEAADTGFELRRTIEEAQPVVQSLRDLLYQLRKNSNNDADYSGSSQ